MSRLSAIALSKRSVTLLLAGALFIAGVSAWGSLKQELLPDIEFPVITIVAPYPGAGSEDVAEQVAAPIERAVSGVPRLETVQSTSANSIALVIAQFEYGTDVKEALAAIEEGIADAGLPESVEPTASAKITLTWSNACAIRPLGEALSCSTIAWGRMFSSRPSDRARSWSSWRSRRNSWRLERSAR